ncbi:hypothetical protein C4D60_Mb09t22330 [Musa balbisiana]|uniref:Uncharacterized protein n=1 Tax=Musa balbisiana TaxID=52838 RepID=A0A4S8II90_MUSBA|nr:hypothetical protein C4D60_Mb09t22330 [Musa balbisiana]
MVRPLLGFDLMEESPWPTTLPVRVLEGTYPTGYPYAPPTFSSSNPASLLRPRRLQIALEATWLSEDRGEVGLAGRCSVGNAPSINLTTSLVAEGGNAKWNYGLEPHGGKTMMEFISVEAGVERNLKLPYSAGFNIITPQFLFALMLAENVESKGRAALEGGGQQLCQCSLQVGKGNMGQFCLSSTPFFSWSQLLGSLPPTSNPRKANPSKA